MIEPKTKRWRRPHFRIAVAVVALLGCLQPAEIALNTAYNAPTWLQNVGTNRIEGSALLRTAGGEPRTCAALQVVLIPVTLYAKERMMHLFASLKSGYRPFAWGPVKFTPESRAFANDIRSTRCDAVGHFEFDRLPDGDWFVVAYVYWQVSTGGYAMSTEGGTLMQRVRVTGGDAARLVLAR